MKRLLFSLLLIMNTASYAEDSVEIPSLNGYLVGLELGLAPTNQLGSAVAFQQGLNTYSYTPYNNTAYPARFGVLIARKFAFHDFENIILGISFHQISTLRVTGELQQGTAAPFYTANYRYMIIPSQVLAEMKVQHQWQQIFFPYVTGGVGVGINKTRYFATNIPSNTVATPTFANNSNNSFSYMLGVGIDTYIAPSITLGVGYVFSDFGAIGLGNGYINGNSLPNYLTQSHFYINSVMAQLNWYC